MRYATWLKRWEKLVKWPKYATVVGVIWKDSSHADDQENSGPIVVFTVGVVLSVSKEEMRIAMEVYEDGTERDVTTIMASLVHKVVPLLYAPLFKEKK